MPELDGQIEALDALLTQVAEAPSIASIREKAEDSGHLDDDWIMSLTTGSVTGEEERNARRHLVFCDQCADLLLNRGGELDEADDLPLIRVSRPERNSPAQSELLIWAKPRLIRVSFGALIVLILVALAVMYLPDLLKVEDQVDSYGMRGREMTVGARGAGEQESGRLSVSRLVYIRLLPRSDTRQVYAYVVAVAANGEVIRLEPKSGRAESFDFSEILELPDEFGGYDLKAHPNLAAGQRVGFFVFTHSDRLPMFEGEIFELTVKLRIVQEAKSLSANLDESNFRVLTGKLRDIGIAGSLVSTSIRLIP
ncbi:MAG: hypothetical protein ACI97A_003084 [Planctomycetota bacterium]|jgi:hypothetical protein